MSLLSVVVSEVTDKSDRPDTEDGAFDECWISGRFLWCVQHGAYGRVDDGGDGGVGVGEGGGGAEGDGGAEASASEEVIGGWVVEVGRALEEGGDHDGKWVAVRRRVLEERLPGMNVAVAKSFFACLDVVRDRWFQGDEGALAKIVELIDATKSRIREAGGGREGEWVWCEGLLRAKRKEAGGKRKRVGGAGREAGGERNRVGVDAPQSAASGGRQCQMPGCSKSAKHNPATRKTEFCKAHGGGPRCQMPGCSKSAQRNPATETTEFCKAHGGGPRCQMPGCSTSAERNPATETTEFCKAHGGGPRCQMPGCLTSAVHNPATGMTEFCVAHGGGPRCKMPGWLKSAKHNPATKKTEFCIAHWQNRMT